MPTPFPKCSKTALEGVCRIKFRFHLQDRGCFPLVKNQITVEPVPGARHPAFTGRGNSFPRPFGAESDWPIKSIMGHGVKGKGRAYRHMRNGGVLMGNLQAGQWERYICTYSKFASSMIPYGVVSSGTESCLGMAIRFLWAPQLAISG